MRWVLTLQSLNILHRNLALCILESSTIFTYQWSHLGGGGLASPKHYNLDQTRQQAPAKLSFSYAEAHT